MNIKKFAEEGLFFTSDTHFSHTNIIDFCGRPFKDADRMNETLIHNWNSVVGPDDIVFHLGDFCLGGTAEWNRILDSLNGRIYLVLGNHDLKNFRQSLTGRFEEVALSMCIQAGSKLLYLDHFPYLCFDGGYNQDVWQLFGHVHTRPENTGIDAERLHCLYPTQLDVGVDNNGFTPLSFGQVRDKIQRQIELANYPGQSV
ncbi:MAG: metallophosphoesterase [Duncaniella sp.]|nr:metallophosphoesterase [Duncaniella sp.]